MESLQVIESSFVAPKEATPPPTEGLWLSPIDLAATRGYTTLVFFYPSGAAFFDAARLKEAMAKALVAFYPLAGRLGLDNDGRLEVSCNGEGVLFVAARSCLAAQDLDFSKPSMELRRVLVPRIELPSLIMAIQVTIFKCGGVALGVACHHAVVDGISTLHFMKTWSAFSRDGDGAVIFFVNMPLKHQEGAERACAKTTKVLKGRRGVRDEEREERGHPPETCRTVIELPCHDRTLLRARSPPVVHPDALSVLYPVTLSPSSRPNATEVFPISRDQLATLRRLCGGTSAFCSVSALVWKCANAVRRLPPDTVARLSFPARYFGNALVSLCAAGAARDIVSEALASVAARVSGALARMDDEVVRSAIDFLELAGSGKQDSRRYGCSLPETELRVVSWLGLPTHDADFGGGAPRLMSRAESVRGGFVHVTDDGPPNQPGGSPVRVIVCMEAANIKEFQRLLYANIAKPAASKL